MKKQETLKLAKEYYKNWIQKSDVTTRLDDIFVEFAADFAEFHHKQQQESIATKMELPNNINSFNRMQVVEFAQVYHKKKTVRLNEVKLILEFANKVIREFGLQNETNNTGWVIGSSLQVGISIVSDLTKTEEP